MRNTEAALKWIVGILHELKIPFEIEGGFAAEFYGSKRQLADIDINVPQEEFDKIVPRVKEYLHFGPGQYQDNNWDLYMMTVKYAGQIIDICALGRIRYFDKQDKKWLDFPADLSSDRVVNFFGVDLPLINEIRLMIIKQQLDRGVDRKDVRAMTDQLKEEWGLD